MADSVNVQTSGSWVGDTIGEFKKLPTWGKAIAVIGAIGAVILIVHLRNKNSSAAIPSATSTGATPPSARGGVLSASSYPQDTNAPIPYQPNYITPTAATPTPATPTPSLWTVLTRGLWQGESDPTGTKALPIFTAPNASDTVGGIPINQQVQVGQSVTGNYFGRQATYYPVNYQGRQGYLLSSDLGNTPPVAGSPPPNSTPVGQGSSGDARGFHIVQYGENMSHVARAYGLKSWKDFGVSEFWHGQKVGIPE
jgi:hypothetical protein